MKLGLAPLSLSLAALALVGSLVTGCKSAPTSTTLPTEGTVTSDPSLAPTAADKCFEQCDVDFKAGTTKFDALDACMEEKCKDIDESTDNRPACAAIDQGKVTYSYGPSDKCMAISCCALAQACADDPGCSGMSGCFSRCSKMR